MCLLSLFLTTNYCLQLWTENRIWGKQTNKQLSCSASWFTTDLSLTTLTGTRTQGTHRNEALSPWHCTDIVFRSLQARPNKMHIFFSPINRSVYTTLIHSNGPKKWQHLWQETSSLELRANSEFQFQNEKYINETSCSPLAIKATSMGTSGQKCAGVWYEGVLIELNHITPAKHGVKAPKYCGQHHPTPTPTPVSNPNNVLITEKIK